MIDAFDSAHITRRSLHVMMGSMDVLRITHITITYITITTAISIATAIAMVLGEYHFIVSVLSSGNSR